MTATQANALSQQQQSTASARRRICRGELSGARVVLKAYPSGRLPEADAMAANEVRARQS